MKSPVPLLVAFLLAPFAGPAAGQSGRQDADGAPDRRLAAAVDAMEKWLTSSEGDRELTGKSTLDRVMAAEGAGLKWLAAQLRTSSDPKRTDRLLDLVGHVGRRWLKKIEKSEMIHAGQYDELKVLMPEIGAFYFTLLLRTPEWFPYNERVRVIAPLRDLFPKGPDGRVMDQVLAMAENRAEEPEDLRTGLANALAQWGNRKLLKAKIRAMEIQARSEDEEVAILGLRRLGEIYYDIREYATAAVTKRDSIRKAEAVGGYDLLPVHYYNTACCLCLSGDRRSALIYLERCLALNSSPKIDSSVRLKRELFERDPEIAMARKTKGFEAMLDLAFGKKSGPAKDKKEDR